VWIQALADLGVIGLALWAAIFGTAAWLALRAARAAGTTTALLGLLWTALLVWLWTAQGFIAGIPLDAVTWLAFGFAAVPVVAARPAE
jgi:O-antigen ligase